MLYVGSEKDFHGILSNDEYVLWVFAMFSATCSNYVEGWNFLGSVVIYEPSVV